jgi:hypothetical protein
MPVLPTSSRLFAPVTNRPLRVRSVAGVFDDADGQEAGGVRQLRTSEREDPPPAMSADAVDALIDALSDVELKALEALDGESFEAVIEELEQRGLKRRHANGFLSLVA